MVIQGRIQGSTMTSLLVQKEVQFECMGVRRQWFLNLLSNQAKAANLAGFDRRFNNH